MKNSNPFRYFKTSPEIIRLAVMMYVRFPLSLRNVEDLLNDRGIDDLLTKVRFAKQTSCMIFYVFFYYNPPIHLNSIYQ